MTNIQEILYRYLNLQLRLMVFSGARSSEGASRIKVRPVMLRDKLVFQCASTVGTKEFHENLERDAAVFRMEEWILRDFRPASDRQRGRQCDRAGQQEGKGDG